MGLRDSSLVIIGLKFDTQRLMRLGTSKVDQFFNGYVSVPVNVLLLLQQRYVSYIFHFGGRSGRTQSNAK